MTRRQGYRPKFRVFTEKGPARHRRHQLRQIPQRKRLGVRLPTALCRSGRAPATSVSWPFPDQENSGSKPSAMLIRAPLVNGYVSDVTFKGFPRIGRTGTIPVERQGNSGWGGYKPGKLQDQKSWRKFLCRMSYCVSSHVPPVTPSSATPHKPGEFAAGDMSVDTGGEFVSNPQEEIWTTVARRLR